MQIIIRHRGKEYKSPVVPQAFEGETAQFAAQFGTMLNTGLSYSQQLENGNILVLGPVAAQEATYEFANVDDLKKVKRLKGD